MTVDHPTAAPDHDSGLGRPVVQSADPIDRVVRLAPKWTVFVLAACGLLVAGIVVWSVSGTVTRSVTTPGLYYERGASSVLTRTEARVDRVLVQVGQQVSAGERVVTLEGGNALVSPQNGTVTAVLVSDGSLMPAGSSAVRVTDLAQPDTVITTVPARMTGTVTVGLPVRLAVSSAPTEQYGYLLGTVDEITFAPYTTTQIAHKLHVEEGIVRSLLGSEPALLAVIRLDHDPSLPSNYRWSVGEGPPFTITQGVPVTAQIILDEEHPLGVVFPDAERSDR